MRPLKAYHYTVIAILCAAVSFGTITALIIGIYLL